MNTSIITIGNEILSGVTLDTNSDYLSKMLFETGASVILKMTVADNESAITRALDYCFAQTTLVILTGGLGPTNDDITKKTLARYFNTELVLFPEELENIKALLKHRYSRLSEAHLSQAYLPKNCKALRNNLGTAPGMLFQSEDKILISLPGVPFEMKSIFENEVIPILRNKIPQKLISLNIKTAGIAESVLAAKIRDIEQTLPPQIALAYLPSVGQVKLRITAIENEENLQIINSIKDKISERIPEFIYGFGDVTIQQAIGQILMEKNLTLSVAESCTGGYISHLLTTVPGSSAYFKGGMVSYANEVKIFQLGVSKKIIEIYGAVSDECVREMAHQIRLSMKTDIGLAVSGIAGPGGATPDKPLGLVYFAVADSNHLESHHLIFDRGRIQNIQFFAISALNFLRQFLK